MQIGNSNAITNGANLSVIGWSNRACTSDSTVIGTCSCSCCGAGNITIGCCSYANNLYGDSDTSFGSVVIGNCSKAEGRTGVAIGTCVTVCQGGRGVAIGTFSHATDNGVAIGSENQSGGNAIAIGCYNLPRGARSIGIGSINEACSGSLDIAMYGQYNTIFGTCCSQTIGICNRICSDFSVAVGQTNLICTSSASSGTFGRCNTICNPGAFAIGCGITSVVANHVHLPNLFFTAATGPYASDACFYAAGGTAGQAYLLCVGSDSYLTIGGYN